MKKLIIYILLAVLFWTLPALATNLGQQKASGAVEAGQAMAAASGAAETTTPTEPTAALLLGAGLIGLVAFSRNRVKD